MGEDKKALLNGLIDIVTRAGDRILEHYQQLDPDVTYKQNHSPLTQADLDSHEIIIDGLNKLTPNVPVLSEEGDAISFEAREKWAVLWCVDPLDGTREFLKRNGEFVICIALIEQHVPTMGLLFAPFFNECYVAAQNLGAFKVKGDVWDPIKTTQNPEKVRTLISRSQHGRVTKKMLNQFSNSEILHVGSGLKFGWLAEGRADFYPRLFGTCEWDTAAGQCILEAAGGCVVDVNGEQLRYNARESLINPNFIALGDPKLLDVILPVWQQINS